MNKRFLSSDEGNSPKKLKLNDDEYSSASPSSTSFVWSQLIPQIHNSRRDRNDSEPLYRLTKDLQKNKHKEFKFKLDQQISDTELFARLELKLTEKFPWNIREIFDVIVFIAERTCHTIENFHNRRVSEHGIKQKFAITQAGIFSELHIENAKKTKSSDPIDEELKHETDYEFEIQEENQNLIQPRRLLAYIILFIKNSVVMSERLFTKDISSDDSNLSVVEKICQTFDQTILRERSKIENLTLNFTLAELLLSLTTHYYEYKNIEAVDKGLNKFFNTILAFSTYDPHIMLCITNSFMNIAKKSNRLKLFSGMCIQYASDKHEYSNEFKIHQFPRNECQLQIFFGLMNHVYRFYCDVKDHETGLLFKLTSNFNSLTQMIISNACDMKFLAPAEDPNKKVCKCYSFLVNALFILNEQTIRHRNIHDKDYERQTTIHAKNALILLNSILKFGSSETSYLPVSVMNELNCWFKMDGNTNQPKCLQKLSKQYPYDQILEGFNEKYSESSRTSSSEVDVDSKKIQMRKQLLSDLMADF